MKRKNMFDGISKDAIKSGEYGGRFTGELMLCERVSDLSRGLVT